MLSELSEQAQQSAEREAWGEYRNVRYDTAQYVRDEGQWKRAGFLYVEVMIFDLQGVTSTQGVNGFSRAYRGASPAVAREVARFTLQADMDEQQLKTVYDRVADQAWLEEFPRPKDEVWEELRDEVWECREGIELDRKVEALGPNQLLSESEADLFIERKNEYEIVRRVESLLEDEPPDQVPPDKQRRAIKYLRAINPEELGNRWKAKAYRRGGEAMLSQGAKEKALDYFERALEAVDRDELTEVERLVKRLRRDLNGAS
jgi:tetratricopeptide (TPR) repeat protein